MSAFDLEVGRTAREPSPAQALAFLWRGRVLILLCTVLGAGAAAWLAEQRGTVYRARSVLYVQRDAPMLPGSDVSLWLQTRNYANTQAALLRSTPVLQSALDRSNLAGSGLFGDSHNHLAWLRRKLTVAVGNEDDVITVSLDAPFVDEACALVNAVVDEYLLQRSRSQRETTSEVLGSLKNELVRYEAEMRAVQAEQVQYLAAHPGVGAAGDVAVRNTDRLRELHAAVTKAELSSIEAEAAWRSAKQQAAIDDPLQRLSLVGGDAALSRATLESLQRLQELQQRRVRLLAEVTADHPTIGRLDAGIAGLQTQVAAESRRVADAQVATLEQRYRGQQRLYEDLAARLREHEQRLRADDPAQAEYRGLEIRFERARKLADTLYERVRALDINDSRSTAERSPLSALVYEYATPGGAAVAASKTSFAAIGTFLGFLVGIGAAWLRSLLDQRLRDADEVAALVPVLATVPRRSSLRRGIGHAWARQPQLVAAMRSLRTVIHFGLRGAPKRVLQVTAAQPGDGASSVAAGLAVAMAQSGQRTLLVDAALAAPAQARLFGIEGECGLRQVLAGELPAAAAVVATAFAGLHVVPAGTGGTGHTAGVPGLDAARLQAVLQEFAGAYDRVLVDSPSLAATVDARIVAAVCDGTVLVVRAGRTTRTGLAAAIGSIAAVAGRVAGAVVNRAARGAAFGDGAVGMAPVQPLPVQPFAVNAGERSRPAAVAESGGAR